MIDLVGHPYLIPMTICTCILSTNAGHQKQKQLEKEEQQQQQQQQHLQDRGGQMQMAPVTPARFGLGPRPRLSSTRINTSPRQFSPHGVQTMSSTSMSPESDLSGANVRHEPYPGARPRKQVNSDLHRHLPHPSNSRNLPTEQGSAQEINTYSDEVIKIETMDEGEANTDKSRTEENKSTADSGIRESGSGTESTSSSAITSLSQNSMPSILPNYSPSAAVNLKDNGSDSLTPAINDESSDVKYSDIMPSGGINLDSDHSNPTGLPSETSNMDTSSESDSIVKDTNILMKSEVIGSDSVVKDSNVDIKSEVIAGSEHDLEIPVVKPGHMTQPNIETGIEFRPSTSCGAQGGAGDQSSQGHSKSESEAEIRCVFDDN